MAAPIRHAYWPALVADVGGTNVRFGLVERAGEAVQQVQTLRCADYHGLAAATEAYLAGRGSVPQSACVAIAGPVVGDRIRLTNRAWNSSIAETRDRLRLHRLAVVNDFEALTLAAPRLVESERLQIGGGRTAAGKPIAVVGPGTGLGVGAAVPAPSGWIAIAGEGGHVEAAAAGPREAAAIASLRRGRPRLSAEMILSGAGLERLHAAFAELDGVAPDGLAAASITEQALAGTPRCAATVARFLNILGGFAGDAALMFGARGGVYIGGGIVRHMVPLLATSSLRLAFENKGRLSSYVQDIATCVIVADAPALTGAAAWLETASTEE